QTGHADLRTLNPISPLIDLLSGKCRSARNGHAHHERRGVKQPETGAAYPVYRFLILPEITSRRLESTQFHSKPKNRFDITITTHAFLPAYTRKIAVERDATYVAKHGFHHAFKHLKYIFLIYKCHLAVDLGKFRLTIGAQIFIAKTFHDLVIPVITGDHQ